MKKPMKLFSAMAVSALFTLTSCSSNKASSDCDKFLNQYEDYMNKYLDIVKKVQADPSNAELMSEMTKLTQEGTQFQNTKPEACKDDKEFLSKFMAIQMKMADRAK
jgi:hypothetical protein